MRRLIITAAALLALATPAAAAVMPITPHPRPLRPCPTEDAGGMRACVWDARHMGNGQGRSYLYLGVGPGRVIFLSHRKAHSLLEWS